MKTALLISFVILIAYIAITAIINFKKNGKLPTSISDTYYLLEGIKPKLGITFIIVFLFIVPFCVAPAMFVATPENWEFLVFFSIMGIMAVGAAPLFKDRHKKVHYAGAILSGAAAFLWAIATKTIWIWAILLVIMSIAIVLIDKKKIVDFDDIVIWLGEIVIFTSIYVSILVI